MASCTGASGHIASRVAALRSELASAVDNPGSGAGVGATPPPLSVGDMEQDLKRRQESYIRRERAYEDRIGSLEDELERLRSGRSEWMANDERVVAIRDMHKQLVSNVEAVRESTARVLKDQERDLLRAFRARLFDIQSELESEKSKADVGASAWIEKNRQLERGLDWAKEMADRLERVNSALQRENQKLKSEYRTQEQDREFLITQLVLVKKDNTLLRNELELKEQDLKRQQDEIDHLTKKRGAGAQPDQGRAAGTATAASATAAAANSPAAGTATTNNNNNVAEQQHVDTRYQEIVRRLKKMLETERANLAKLRAAYAADLKTRTELETMLRQVVEDVRVNIVRHRKIAQISSAAPAHTQSTPNLGNAQMLPKLKGLAAASAEPLPFQASEMTQEDRERVIEILLSQERVVALLYKKAFPASRAAPTPSAALANEDATTQLHQVSNTGGAT
jgi:hypothetical protein